MTPGIYIKVDNSLSWTSENVLVNVFSNVLFPTEGKPMRPIQASPNFMSSKPSPLAAQEHIIDSTCPLLNLTILAFNKPR